MLIGESSTPSGPPMLTPARLASWQYPLTHACLAPLLCWPHCDEEVHCWFVSAKRGGWIIRFWQSSVTPGRSITMVPVMLVCGSTQCEPESQKHLPGAGQLVPGALMYQTRSS
jgi:hypothetical protein